MICIQCTRVLHSLVITLQYNPPISQFHGPCNEFTSVWSMFLYNTQVVIHRKIHTCRQMWHISYIYIHN